MGRRCSLIAKAETNLASRSPILGNSREFSAYPGIRGIFSFAANMPPAESERGRLGRSHIRNAEGTSPSRNRAPAPRCCARDGRAPISWRMELPSVVGIYSRAEAPAKVGRDAPIAPPDAIAVGHGLAQTKVSFGLSTPSASVSFVDEWRIPIQSWRSMG